MMNVKESLYPPPLPAVCGGLCSICGGSERGVAAFAGFDAEGDQDRQDENFALAALAGVGALVDGIDDGLHLMVVAGDLHPHFRGQLDIGEIPVVLAKTAGMRNGQAGQMLFIEVVEQFMKMVGGNDGQDEFHINQCNQRDREDFRSK